MVWPVECDDFRIANLVPNLNELVCSRSPFLVRDVQDVELCAELAKAHAELKSAIRE
jgi:hypothetical protein